jgi:hypothetical protein
MSFSSMSTRKIEKKKTAYESGDLLLSTRNILAIYSRMGLALRPDGLRSGRSAVVARTVRACVDSVRVLSFSRDLLAKTVGLARETTCSGFRPPLYIDERLRPIEPPTIDQIKSISRFTYALGVVLV